MIIKYKKFTCSDTKLRIISACVEYDNNNVRKDIYNKIHIEPNSKHKVLFYYLDHCWKECTACDLPNDNYTIYTAKDAIYIRMPDSQVNKFDLGFNIVKWNDVEID